VPASSCQYAARLKKRRSRMGRRWHPDKVFVKMNRVQHYLWRAVDQNRAVIDREIESASSLDIRHKERYSAWPSVTRLCLAMKNPHDRVLFRRVRPQSRHNTDSDSAALPTPKSIVRCGPHHWRRLNQSLNPALVCSALSIFSQLPVPLALPAGGAAGHLFECSLRKARRRGDCIGVLLDRWILSG
jgi:hypothetical protein